MLSVISYKQLRIIPSVQRILFLAYDVNEIFEVILIHQKNLSYKPSYIIHIISSPWF